MKKDDEMLIVLILDTIKESLIKIICTMFYFSHH